MSSKTQIIREKVVISYTRMLSGRFKEPKSEANFLTDANELRSNSSMSTLAVGIFLIISSLIVFPAAKFRIPITTWTPRNARTLAVSAPMPLDAPAYASN